MIARAVDTNIAVVANGRDSHASAECRKACVQHLIKLRNGGRVVLDVDGAIITEYAKRLKPEGQPGVGDLFYRHVLDNRGNAAAVSVVDPQGARTKALRDGFVKGSLSNFAEDDRVFAFVSVVARVPVSTAIDSDWAQHEVGLKACGVMIDYVCGRPAAVRGGSD